MEDFRLVFTKKTAWRLGFYNVNSKFWSFGGIGESEFHFKDHRSVWLCNQVCLLECKGFDWHSDGTNQNWVDLEQTEVKNWDDIDIVSRLWKF